jgi:hypothetical protein
LFVRSLFVEPVKHLQSVALWHSMMKMGDNRLFGGLGSAAVSTLQHFSLEPD